MGMRINMCRICLKEERVRAPNLNCQMINIFDDEKIVQQIHDCTGLMIEADEALPEKICRKCLVLLESAVSFRETCRNSYQYLNSLKEKSQDNITKDVKPKDHKNDSDEYLIAADPIAENAISIVENIYINNDAVPCTQVHKENVNKFEECGMTENSSESSLSDTEDSDTEWMHSLIKKKPSNHDNTKLRKRRKATDDPPAYICDQCGRQFTCHKYFITHLNRHAGEKPYQCEFCSEKFYIKQDLIRHIRRHTGERPYGCRHCERRFICTSSRTKHERTHTNERPYACTQCDKAFNNSYILKNHMLVHTGERLFMCRICNRSFQRQTHLSTHYRSITHKQNVAKQEQQQELLNETAVYTS